MIVETSPYIDTTIFSLDTNMSALVDSNVWRSKYTSASFVYDQLTFSGIATDGSQWIIGVVAIQPGTYSMSLIGIGSNDSRNYTSFIASIGGDTTEYSFTGGYVTLNELDTVNKTISGTFDLTLRHIFDNKMITNGKFEKIKYH